jgi:GxxExxY protein
MPIKVPSGLRALNYEQFAQVSYEVMEVVFAVHKELGRLFDEAVYQTEIACRLKDAHVEVPIEVWFESFSKTYYLDLVSGGGALLELKAVEALTDRHRAQLLNYLLLAELLHGKLVNMRPEAVEHEFVNAAMTREDRIHFAVVFKLSALGETGRRRYESHLYRFLAHTSLGCIQWINVGRKVVTFKTLKR